MLYSIIIPTYNYAHLITRALDSVLMQSDKSWELIIVDDGSSDNTKEVVNTYIENSSQPIHYIYQNNQGPATARNTGVKHAKGDYMLFLDADDHLRPSALREFRLLIQQHSSSKLFIAAACRIHEDGKRKTKMPGKVSNSCESNFINALRGHIKMPTGSYVIHKNVFETLSYPEGLSHCEDGIFLNQVIANFRIATTDAITVNIQKHAGSQRHNFETGSQLDFSIADVLFDPEKMPEALMKYKNEYLSLFTLELARLYAANNRYNEALTYYHKAFSFFPKHLLKWHYVRKYIKTAYNTLVTRHCRNKT